MLGGGSLDPRGRAVNINPGAGGAGTRDEDADLTGGAGYVTGDGVWTWTFEITIKDGDMESLGLRRCGAGSCWKKKVLQGSAKTVDGSQLRMSQDR